MTARYPRNSILLVIAATAISQLMCNAPGPIKGLAVQSLDKDVDFSELNSGIFDVTKFDVQTHQHSGCPTNFTLPEGSGVTFETVEDGVFVTNADGRTYYPKTGPREYCRLSNEGTPVQERITCLENLSETGFDVSVRVQFELEDDPDDDFEYFDCYRANYALENSLQGLIDEVADEENASEDGFQSDTDTSNQTGFDLAQCIPEPGEYAYEIISLSDRSSDVKHRCNADGILKNTSDQDLSATAYRVHFYGGFDYEKWVYSRGIAPGETAELTEFYHCTGGECGAGEWFYFTEIAVYRATAECTRYVASFEDPPAEFRVPVSNPCDW